VIKVLHASLSDRLYIASIDAADDIAALVCDTHLESLTSSDGLFDFWFTPSIRAGHHRVNRRASAMFLAHTRLGARTAPLLRGNVVVASHDASGNLLGLTQGQFDHFLDTGVSGRARRILARRCDREEESERRRAHANEHAVLEGWLYGP